jgi:hypothetical protein
MIKSYKDPQSAFMSVEKDLTIITDKILQDERLKKLLFYTSRDALRKPKLTDEQSIELFGKNIKIVPKLYIDGSVLTYIIISFDNFTTNTTNPQFRDNTVTFDIVCHFNQWQLEDFQLRPYRIAAELDTLFNNQRLTGIGLFQFLGCTQIILNDEFAGLTLMYSAIHGGEDKNFNEDQRDLLDPLEEEQYRQEFNATFNNGRDIQ